MTFIRHAISLIFVLLVAAQTGSGQSFDFFARGPYAQGAPRPEGVLGYPMGTRHSYYHQMEAYLNALANAPTVSGRMRLETYGNSFEGRKLWIVFISSEQNISKLEEIRQQILRLRDPRAISEAEARTVAASTPAIVWLNYANDGNESAAFEAGMQTTYQLVAGEDAVTRSIREQVLTIIIPAHNPESHERFAAWFNAVVQGRDGNEDPSAAEHHGDWLMNSNDNHFHMDLNRDAFALTQVESQAIVRQIHRWNPQVFIDHHGNPPIFFFPPVAKPVNKNYPEIYSRWEEIYGRAIAAEFDKYGWSYMNREVFDLFFPGYYDSYPSLNGAIGMTFETDGGGSRGLRLRRPDGTISTLLGGVAKHFSGSLAVLEATARNREQRLLDFYLFRKTGLEEAERESMKQILLVEGADRGRFRAFLELLLAHGIEVYRTSGSFQSAKAHSYMDDKVAPKHFASGTYVVPLPQPQKRLAKALLEPQTQLDEQFLKEEMAKKERNEKLGRRAGREQIRFYDITAWSLPLTFGIEAYWTEDRATALERVTTESLRAVSLTGGLEGGRGRYGYVFRYDSNASAKLIAQLLKEDFRLTVFRSPVRIGAESYSPGTILLRTERNPESLHERVAALARELSVPVRAVQSAWTESGITLGSGRITDIRRPRVAIATYEPTNGRAYGSLWFLFEQTLDYPFTPIRTEMLASVNLSEYDVLVFPDGSEAGYQQTLGSEGVARIKQWIENGGVFIGIKGGAAFATRRNVEWTSSRLVGREPAAARPAGAAPASGAGANSPQAEREVERTPGAILRVDLNPAHFLTFGYDVQGPEVVMHNSAYIFTPTREGTNVVSFAQNPRVSGFVWPDTEKRIIDTPYLIDENVGRGHVILFADDPNFRLVWPRLTRLFLNAVFLAPSLR